MYKIEEITMIKDISMFNEKQRKRIQRTLRIFVVTVKTKSIQKAMIVFVCFLYVFCYLASEIGKGLVAALVADAIMLVAADLDKVKEG